MLRLVALTLSILVVAAPAASAKKRGPSSRCADRPFAKVFKPWNDRGRYTPAPGGDFETAAAGWKLAGAAVAADNSPFLLAGSAPGASSLELPAGASALSPPICVERGLRSLRFVARSVLPAIEEEILPEAEWDEEEVPLEDEEQLDEEQVDEEWVDEEELEAPDEPAYEHGELTVEVVLGSGRKAKQAGRFSPDEAWAPMRKASFAQGKPKAPKRRPASVRLRFTATAGVVRVDDVYVDPRFRR